MIGFRGVRPSLSTGGSRVASGTIVGIQPDRQESVVRKGLQLVIRAQMVLAGVGFLALILAGGAPQLLSTVRQVVLMLAVLVILGLLLLLTLPRSSVARGRGMLNPLRLLALPVTSSARDRTVCVLSLMVKEVSGAEVACVLRGRLSSTLPHGAIVEVYGRSTGEHSVKVRRLVVTPSGPVITVSRPVTAAVTEALVILIGAGWTVLVALLAWRYLSTK